MASQVVLAIWRNHRAKLAISTFCLLVALFDTFWQAISPIAAAALALAIVPWIVGIVERISTPGGFELVFKQLEERLEDAKAIPDQSDIDAFRYFETEDSNLSIAMLRVQIERRLREIAEDIGLEDGPRGRPRSLRSLAAELEKRGAIPIEAVFLLADLMPVMNDAVHGVEISKRGGSFALDSGPKILAMLRSV